MGLAGSHHLGFAWHDGRLGKPVLMLCIAGAALELLYTLIFHGPYPLAMVGSPDKAVSNSLPPKITLLILGLIQFGVLHALEKPMQKLLSNAKLWTLTVLVNSHDHDGVFMAHDDSGAGVWRRLYQRRPGHVLAPGH
ncbi:hypothetical protein GCM10027217_09110 [Pseudomaricurvus hydrocarbonicus]